MKWPDGVQSALALTFDFDAESLWLANNPRHKDLPGVLSLGKYGAKVGVPKILKLLRQEEIRATFFVPGLDRLHLLLVQQRGQLGTVVQHQHLVAIENSLEVFWGLRYIDLHAEIVAQPRQPTVDRNDLGMAVPARPTEHQHLAKALRAAVRLLLLFRIVRVQRGTQDKQRAKQDSNAFDRK